MKSSSHVRYRERRLESTNEKNKSCKLSEKLHPTIFLQGLNKYMTKRYSNRDTLLYLRALSSARQ
jgi:hypothetical protein